MDATHVDRMQNLFRLKYLQFLKCLNDRLL
jgi:hypothetical protein